MRATTASFFQRLRLHKGAWMLVALALLIKFAASTACLLDGPGAAAAGDVAHVAATVTIDGDGDGCLLGEAGGCHCACNHTVTLPPSTLSIVASTLLPTLDPHLPAAPLLRPAASPLRPPIAA